MASPRIENVTDPGDLLLVMSESSLQLCDILVHGLGFEEGAGG